jgi:UDP-4-amino-4,6-dideoxy-N-acetyl-beta-L-altrosamine transaminase
VIPYGRQDVSADDIAAVVRVLESDWLTQGPAVPSFEAALTAATGAAHAVAVANATAALHIACVALGVAAGSRVWTSANTFVASANCARYCGAEVDFVDIDPETYNMSVAALAARLEEARARGCLPDVVIPVHFAGQACDMREIHRLAGVYGFRIIEDASHAIGATHEGRPVGAGTYSDITVFSFHPVKIVTTGEGGAALTQDERLAKALRLLRSHGITRDAAALEGGSGERWYYEQQLLGWNYRMTDLQAALGTSQMSRLEAFVERRRRLAARYDRLLADTGLILPAQAPHSVSAYHLYPVQVDPAVCGHDRREVFDRLRDGGIGVNVHYIPAYLNPYYRALGFSPGYCPAAELYYSRAITLPLYPGLDDARQDEVVTALRAALA